MDGQLLYLSEKIDFADLIRGLVAGAETLIENKVLAVVSSKDIPPGDDSATTKETNLVE